MAIVASLTRRSLLTAISLLGMLWGCSRPPSAGAPEARPDVQAGVAEKSVAPAASGRAISVRATSATLSVSAASAPWRDVLSTVAAAGDIVVTAHLVPDGLLNVEIGPMPTDAALRTLAGAISHRVSRGTDGRWRLDLGDAKPQPSPSVRSARQDLSTGSPTIVITETYGRDASGQKRLTFNSEQPPPAPPAFFATRDRPAAFGAAGSDRALTVMEESYEAGFSQRQPAHKRTELESSVLPFGGL